MSQPGELGRGRRYRRRPFLLVQWQDQDLVVFDCDSLRRFRVDPALLELLARLDDWRSAEGLAADGQPVPEQDLARLAELGIVEALDQGQETEGLEPVYWNAFDLAVHRQSNIGGYRDAEVRARSSTAPPGFKERPTGMAVALPGPRELIGSVSDVLARRRSIRTYGPDPLDLQSLSTLLYHSARVVAVSRDELLGDLASRPYPAGGARSELEIYVVANDVAGLAQGAFYYDARAHDLTRVRYADDHQARINRLLHAAAAGMLNRDPPAALLVTAVFGRVMWKYSGIGLSLIYKNTGCLIQTLYMVATALELAPCAVGGGEERANAEWLGLDPLVESQVGCFLVGPRQPTA